MAWRKKEPVEKCAFPGGMASGIRAAIRTMEQKQERFNKDDFSAEDLLRLFIEPEDRAVLCRAWDIVEPAGTSQELFAQFNKPDYATSDQSTHPYVYLKFRWTRSSLAKGFYVPYRDGSAQDRPVRMRDDAPEELQKRFVETVKALCDVHWRFSRVQMVFSRLNKEGVCQTPAAMRYVWPCIHTLCNEASLEHATEETREPNERLGSRVRVPLSIINILKETSDTVLRAQFLDGVEPDMTTLPIPYALIHNFPVD